MDQADCMVSEVDLVLKIPKICDDELYISTGVALGGLEDAGVGGAYGSEDGQPQ